MKAVDKAGNEKETEGKTQQVSEVPVGGTGTTGSNIEFSYSTTNWTNKPVDVTIKNNTGGPYSIEYSLKGDNSDWTKYLSPVPMKTNGSIYARLVDSDGQAGTHATGNVGNIDTTPPTVTASAGDITPSNIILTVTASSDTGGSGLKSTPYQYYLNNTVNGSATADKTHNFESLAMYTTFTLKVEVWDNAGNKGEAIVSAKTQCSGTTKKCAGGGTTTQQYCNTCKKVVDKVHYHCPTHTSTIYASGGTCSTTEKKLCSDEYMWWDEKNGVAGTGANSGKTMFTWVCDTCGYTLVLSDIECLRVFSECRFEVP